MKGKVNPRVGGICADPSHPGQSMMLMLPSGRTFRSQVSEMKHRQVFHPWHSEFKMLLYSYVFIQY